MIKDFKMKNIILSIVLALVSFANLFAQTKQTLPVDTFKIGSSASAFDTTIELSPTNKIRHNKTTGKTEFTTDGTIWKKLGSGSGGGSGAFSLLENGGFEDGVATGWSFTGSTVTPVNGSSALLGDVSAQFDPSALNDYFRTNYLTVPKGLRGSACEAKFLYTGGDALNFSARVENEAGVVLGTYNNGSSSNVLKIHNQSGYESIFFKCPTEADITALSTNGNIRLVIYQGTATNAAAMVIDDAHLGALIGLTETAIPDVFAFVMNGLSGSVAVTRTDGLYPYTCTRLSTGSYSCPFGTTFGTAPACSVTAIGPPQVEIFSTVDKVDFTLRTAGTNTPVDSGSVEIICKKLGADAKQSVQVYKSIPKLTTNINNFSATSNAGTLFYTDAGFVSSVSSPGTGKTAYVFGTGLFTEEPFCQCSTYTSDGAQDQTCKILSLSVSGATVYNTVNGTANNSTHVLTCFRRLSEVKMPTVQPIIIGQLTTSAAESSLTNVRMESCAVFNNGTITLQGTLCNTWLSSVQRTGAGAISWNIISGIFSEKPNCVVSTDQSQINLSTSVTTALVFTQTRNASGTAIDGAVVINCMGKR